MIPQWDVSALVAAGVIGGGGGVAPAPLTQFEDDFSTVSPVWDVICGAFTVEEGMLVATAIEREGTDLIAGRNADFETGDLTRWSVGSDASATVGPVAGGGGDYSATITSKTDDVSVNKYVLLSTFETYGGCSLWASARLRKATEDAYPIELWCGNTPTPELLQGTLSTEWTTLSGYVELPDEVAYGSIRGQLAADAPTGVAGCIDDARLELLSATQVVTGWASENVQIEAEFYSPETGSGRKLIVLRYVDAHNYVAVAIRPNLPSYKLTAFQVTDNYIQILKEVNITWSSGGYDRVRVRLYDNSLCVDTKLDGENWTIDRVRVGITNTHSTRHGLAVYRTNQPTFRSISFSEYVSEDEVGVVFQRTIAVPGVLATNVITQYDDLPWCELTHVSMVQSNAGAGRVKIGTTLDDDTFLFYTNMGKSGVPVELAAPLDFRYVRTPNISSNDTFVVTIDYDGAAGTPAQDVEIVMTFVTI